ncbi:MAG: beta-mannosidase [Clostridia bacterium]|nr:beta-mannosidase [Clostridia bacterium]
MIKKAGIASLWRRSMAAGMAALGLWAGAALAEDELVAKVEAEAGTLLGKAKVAATGQSVSGLELNGDGVQVTLNVPEAGHYDIVVRQATVGGGVKINFVEANGQRVGEITSPNSSWNDGVVEYVWLDAGENTVSVTKSYGWIAIDYIGLKKSAGIPADVYDVEPTLVNPNATEEAKRLMTFLCDNYGKNVISGQQCQDGPFGLDNAAIWRATGGSYPAVLGMDLISYSPARVQKGDQTSVVESAIEYWEKGGIITLAWHWCPDGRYDNGKNNWGTFYTENTRFNLKKAMNGTDKAGYQMLLDDIDAIAVQLKRLQDAGVPILWRPLHEASGGWFWWGASGAEPYLELYKLMYDRLTNHHGLNNLIWVWNGQDAAWYPGDEYVDVIGEDIYPGEKVYTSQAARFLKALSYTDTRKLITLSENGCVPDTDLLIRDNVMWSWWCTWEGEFVLKTAGFNAYSEQYTEKSVLLKVYKHDNVITRKTLPDLKTYPLRAE